MKVLYEMSNTEKMLEWIWIPLRKHCPHLQKKTQKTVSNIIDFPVNSKNIDNCSRVRSNVKAKVFHLFNW